MGVSAKISITIDFEIRRYRFFLKSSSKCIFRLFLSLYLTCLSPHLAVSESFDILSEETWMTIMKTSGISGHGVATISRLLQL